jgi:hypothetical protein
MGGAEVIWGGPQRSSFICNDKTLCGVVHSAHPHNGLRPNRAHAALPMVWGRRQCARLGCLYAVGDGRVANPPAAMIDTTILISFGRRGVSGTSMIVHRIL